MVLSGFSRTFSDITCGDGSLSKSLQDNNQNCSVSGAFGISRTRPNSKTPTRTPTRSGISDDPYNSIKKTPNCSTNKMLTVHECDGDRFIPNRSSTNMSRARHVIQKCDSAPNDDAGYHQAVTESLNTNDCPGSRILRYNAANRDSVCVNYPTNSTVPTVKGLYKRAIPMMPEKVLDAPDILDDFYLNILDWSVDNILAVALNQEVYLWNSISGDITCLMSCGFDDEYVSSLKWSPDSPNIISVGLSAGRVQLWDASSQSLVRTMRLGGVSSAGRVPAVTWREYLVSSASKSGHIRHHDTRVAHHEVGISDFHTQEVCGLTWSPDKRFLASGANDNFVGVWSCSDTLKPVHVLRDHQAAVKAVAWCPWKPNLLCTGGGTSDHTLRFWNATTAVCVKSVDVIAQVSGIIWNTEYREILTSHGDPLKQLIIWKYPEITKVTDLKEHQGRVLCVAPSPNDEMVASCASDETLRIWHCFQVDHNKKRIQEKGQRPSVFARGIR
ncbi:Cell division cycle protein 20 like [Schistosoma japonicum]|nr:Cell division cycle protein 20 like [Schistosoma japonicum]KAH8855121.1 Cell division cycle protein 20 like [Schistosoma japonicum]